MIILDRTFIVFSKSSHQYVYSRPYVYSGSKSTTAQSPEMILNKIANTFNKIYTGLTSMMQRFQIYFSQNFSYIGVESTIGEVMKH